MGRESPPSLVIATATLKEPQTTTETLQSGRRRSPLTLTEKQTSTYILKTLIAGGLAGCAAKTVIAPFDRVKILFQTSNPKFEKYSGSFLGVFRAGDDIWQSHGWRGLFQGHSATLLRIFPYAAIKFMAYEQIKYRMMPTKDQESPGKRFLAGSLAGCTSVFVSYPLELLRVRLAYEVHFPTGTSSKQRVTLSSASRLVYAETPLWTFLPRPLAGLSNFYKGFMPTIYGMIPYAGVSFLTYESLKTFASTHFTDYTTSLSVQDKHSKPRLRAWAFLACGALSGALAQTASYPFEVIRRQMQISGSLSQNGIPSHNSTFGTIKSIMARKGFKGFFVGLSIGYMKVTPMFAVSFYTYEFLKSKLGIDD